MGSEKEVYIKKADSRTQYVKLMEEAGELAQALLKKDATKLKMLLVIWLLY